MASLVLFTSADPVPVLFEVTRTSAFQGGIKVNVFELPV